MFSRNRRGTTRPGTGMVDFAFIVHPRSVEDVFRKYAFFKHLPEKFLTFLMMLWPCVSVAVINGVRRVNSGEELQGLLLGISLTPEMMLRRPELVCKKVAAAIKKARERGARIIGLGGWIPAFTGYGLDVEKRTDSAGITTGHAYAAWTIVSYVQEAFEKKNIEVKKPEVAIVGAAGSTGSLVAELVINSGLCVDLLLVDVPKKSNEIEAAAMRYRTEKGVCANTSVHLSSLAKVDIIVVVSSAGEVILEPEHVKEGAIIIDDTQPRNTSESLMNKATVIDVLSQVPGLSIDFDMGLVKERPEITFTCLAEVAILAAHGWRGDISIGRPDQSKVSDIAKMAEACGVSPARFVSFGRIRT